MLASLVRTCISGRSRRELRTRILLLHSDRLAFTLHPLALSLYLNLLAMLAYLGRLGRIGAHTARPAVRGKLGRDLGGSPFRFVGVRVTTLVPEFAPYSTEECWVRSRPSEFIVVLRGDTTKLE